MNIVLILLSSDSVRQIQINKILKVLRDSLIGSNLKIKCACVHYRIRHTIMISHETITSKNTSMQVYTFVYKPVGTNYNLKNPDKF